MAANINAAAANAAATAALAAETAADTARLEAALLDLRHQYQAAQADALDEHMGVCRDTLTAWIREAARRKRN